MPITIAEVVQIVIEIVKLKDEETSQRKKAEAERDMLRSEIDAFHTRQRNAALNTALDARRAEERGND